MFIFKKHLDRRTFLQGMGATVAVPLLDAMMPALSAAPRPVPRMAFVYFPHGAIMDAWTPAADGPLQALGPILDPLTPFRDRLTIVSGIENRHAYGPVHAITPGTWLSGASPCCSREVADWTTADQIAAGHLGRETPLPSIEAAAEPPRAISTGPWEGSYDQCYATTLSFRSSEPRPMEAGPRRLFDRLFRRDDSHERSAETRREASILDLVADDVASLPRRLGARDRATVREYFDAIRDIERRVDQSESLTLVSDGSHAAEQAFTGRLSLMFDLIALAFRADITRVASLMMAAETSAMTYGHVGVADPFHLLSHHQNDPGKIASLVRIQHFHTSAFAGFVRTLASLPDGDASVLDRALILFGSNMSDSYRHDHYPLPLAVVGGGCGALCGGSHVRCDDRTPLSNLLVTLLQRADVPVTAVGESTGACTHL